MSTQDKISRLASIFDAMSFGGNVPALRWAIPELATMPPTWAMHAAHESYRAALVGGLSKQEAVEAAVCQLEDCPGRDKVWSDLLGLLHDENAQWPKLVMFQMVRGGLRHDREVMR